MTRAFDDTVAWLTAHSPASAVSAYMRVSWRTVTRIVERVVAEHTGSVDQLKGLRRIGIDEIAYRKGRRYLIVIVDHDTGRLVWAAEGANQETLRRFFDDLGDQRSAQLTHVTADGAKWIAAVVNERVPQAVRCLDPFHVIQWANEALDRCRARLLGQLPDLSSADRRQLRWALWKNPENLSSQQRRVRDVVIAESNSRLAEAYQLKESLRHLFFGQYKRPRAALLRWIRRAQISRNPEMRTLSLAISRNCDHIVNAIEHRLTNAKVEATNTHLRALTKRSYGFHTPERLIAMATLTRGGACPVLPQQ